MQAVSLWTLSFVVHYGFWCLFLLFPQRSCSVKGSFWEAAAFKSAQVQLLPLCPGSVRQTRPACGGGKDSFCGFCWAWKGAWDFSTCSLLISVYSFNLSTSFERLKKQTRSPKSNWQIFSCIWDWSHPESETSETADGCLFTQGLPSMSWWSGIQKEND